MTIERLNLSQSVHGRPIKLSNTAAPGNLIHVTDGSTSADELYVWVANTSPTARTLSIHCGGIADPDDFLCKSVSIPANSPPIPILTGQQLGNAYSLYAFCSSSGDLNLFGYVNRITP